MNKRDAKIEDALQLVNLVAQMGPSFEMSLEAMQARITAFNRSGHKIIVAEEGDLIIGVIGFGCYEQLRLPGSCCHIDTLVVDKNFQHTGVGKSLVASAEKYAEENGAICLELITANHRRKSGTHKFYESLGYQDHAALDYTYFSKETAPHGLIFSKIAPSNSSLHILDLDKKRIKEEFSSKSSKNSISSTL